MAIDATPAGPNSNSYVSLADADAWFALGMQAAAWDAYVDADKSAALIEATRMIESLRLIGIPYDTDTPQALHFPLSDYTRWRSVVADEFEAALGTAVDLARSQLEEGSVYVTADDGTTEYSEGSDYEIDYDAGTVTALVGGDITEAETCLISYDYLGIPKSIEQACCLEALHLREVVGGGGSTAAVDLFVRRELIAQGVKSISMDGASETYEGSATHGFCTRAWDAVRQWVQRTAEIG
jgi:hypothetical protein